MAESALAEADYSKDVLHSIACPTCGAPPKRMCQEDGQFVWHSARINVVLELL